MTKEEIWEKLETEFKLRGYSQKSISTYKAGITTFLDWANKPYEDLDEEDFRNYLIHIIQEGKLKPQTINSKNSAIRFFLVVILGKNVNPMRTARLRGVLNLPNVWSKETVERFFSVIDNPRDMAIFMNIYGSGLRISEICRLKVEDIDSKRMRIFVLQGKFNRDRYTIDHDVFPFGFTYNEAPERISSAHRVLINVLDNFHSVLRYLIRSKCGSKALQAVAGKLKWCGYAPLMRKKISACAHCPQPPSVPILSGGLSTHQRISQSKIVVKTFSKKCCVVAPLVLYSLQNKERSGG